MNRKITHSSIASNRHDPKRAPAMRAGMKTPPFVKVLSIAMLAVVASLLTGADALAQGFPNRPVRIVSAYPAGISPDIAVRILADRLSKYWNQQVMVEPRPGANGFIAIGAAKNAPPDGYTLLLIGNAHMAINPHLFKSVPYSVDTDLVPVSTIYRAPFFLAVASSGPYRTVADIIAAAKAGADKVTYSTPYVGSPPHLGGGAFAHLTGTRMLAVHYKDGVQVYTSVASGDIGFTIGTIGSLSPLMRGGRLKILAIAARSRFASEPNIPTMEEAGGPADLVVESWIGLVAPRGTPAEVAGRISGDMAKVLGEADVRERMLNDGVVATAMTPAEMAQLIRSDSRFYSDLIKRIGLQAE